MIKAILLDCGGVLVCPPTGDWLLGPDYKSILGESFVPEKLEAFRKARRAYLHLLPDTNRVDTDEVECEMFIPYYERTLGEIGIVLSPEALQELSRMQVYRDDRYHLFEDVLPTLKRWHGQYKLGIVSDAPPSTRRIMWTMGVMDYMDGATFSCEIGKLKPDAEMYLRTLRQLEVAPQEAVFVDDLSKNLRGAQALGIHAVQMRRPMPRHFPAFDAWEGPIIEELGQLDAILQGL